MIAGEAARIKHLLRRTAFGYRVSEWKYWADLGEHRALDALVDYESTPDHIPHLPTDSYGALVAPQDTDALKRYWLFRFCETKRPLEETMTLFWHGHFATSDYKVQNPSMEYRQHQLFRKHAMGNFRELMGAIATDPAMLVWLDGNNSTKKAPNENFSRELLELFSMGVDGGYTEKDVKEGAKAFTGWSYDDDRAKLTFHPDRYNPEKKEYLGHSGPIDIEQTLDIVAAHPSTAKFISRKLFEYFVHDDPSKEEMDRLCKIYFDTHYSIRELVRGVLTTPSFYSKKALYSRIKMPVQFTVMTVKTLDVPYKWMNDMQSYADTMGQQLYNPPNVKGWKMGASWINTNTMTARLNFSIHAIDQLRYRGMIKDHTIAAMAHNHLDAEKVFSSAETAVDEVWNWLMPSAIMPDHTRKQIEAYMKFEMPKKPDKNFFWNRADGLIELIMTCPEYQMA